MGEPGTAREPGPLLVDGGQVHTADPHASMYPKGCVLVDRGRIVAVGPAPSVRPQAQQLAASRGATLRTLDASGQLVLPGFVNPHWHEGAARRLQLHQRPPGDTGDEPSPFARGGDIHALSQTFDALYSWHESMTPEESRAVATYAMWTQLRSGTTTLGDVGSVAWPESLTEAARAVGIRAVLSVWASDAECHRAESRFTRTRSADAVLARVESQLAAAAADTSGRIRAMPSAIYPPNMTDELGAGLGELAERYDTPLATHIGALANEAGVVRAYFGRPSIRRFADLGLLTDRLIAVHCAFADAEERAMLLRAGVHISHAPAKYGTTGEAAMRGGLFLELRKAGLDVSVSTDGEAQQLGAMPEAMRQAWLGHNELAADNTAVRASDALAMATRLPARGLRWAEEIGSIEPGKRADLVLVSVDDWRHLLAPRPLESFLKLGGSADVDTVFVDGQILIEGKRAVALDEHTIVSQYLDAARAVAARHGWPLGGNENGGPLR